jgi:hypothetical protein
MERRIGHREFVDGTRRPIYRDEQGQYVLDDDGERVYGVWLIPEVGSYELPLIVAARLPSRLRITRTAVTVRPNRAASSASGAVPSSSSCHCFQPFLPHRSG